MYPKSLLLLFFFLWIISIPTIAQNFDLYQPSTANKPLPKALITSSTEKYLKEKEENQENLTRKERKVQNKFFLQNHFVLDELLSSGQLLFNEPMSNYVGVVLDKILKEDPKLRKQITHYVVRSGSVNAFATDRGEIFVNLGLLAKLNNEAELAFILCHEVQHYVERHNLNSYVEHEKITRRQEKYKEEKYYQGLLEKHSYSKSLEREADKLGLELFLASDYSVDAAKGVFDLLGLAHSTYSNEPFDLSFFNNDFIRLSLDTILNTVNPIVPYADENDELSTHPSLNERRTAFDELVNASTDGGKLKFVQPKETFDKIQKIARFDICDVLVSHRAYAAAIYHSYLLLKEYPDNSYAEKNIAKSLYGIAQYTNAERYSDISPKYDSIQGEIQKVFHLFENLDEKQINLLAARKLWDAHKKYPKDKGIELMAKDMIEDLVIFQIDKPTDFFVKETLPANLDSTTFVQYAFNDIIKNETFGKWIANGEKYRKRRLDAESDTLTSEEKYEEYIEDRKKEREEREIGASLGQRKAIFINPYYFKIDETKKEPLRLVDSEELQLKFKGWIKEASSKQGLKATILDDNHIRSKNAIDNYNEIVAINRYIDEYRTNKMYMISSNYNEVLPITQKYKTSTIVYTGVFIYREKKGKLDRGVNLLLTVYPVTTPLGIMMFISKRQYGVNFAYVFDFEKNTVVHQEVNNIGKDQPGVIKSELYWLVMQIRKKK